MCSNRCLAVRTMNPAAGCRVWKRVKRPLYLFDRETREKNCRTEKHFSIICFICAAYTSDSFFGSLREYMASSADALGSFPGQRVAHRDAGESETVPMTLWGNFTFSPSGQGICFLLLFECQKTDGWFPRQISAKGRRGKHDLREFVDGGAFVVEFLYEYLCVTGDFDLLRENCLWLDSDRPAQSWSMRSRLLIII